MRGRNFRAAWLQRRSWNSLYLGLAAIGIGLPPASAQTTYNAPPAIQQLTVATWIVELEHEQDASQTTTTTTSSWRNTFGRERKTARWRKLGKRSIDADIVVLKQLKSLKDVRRLFPARTHQLIASRAALANANQRLERIAGNDVEPAHITYDSFPAIAVRRRRGLRVTAVRHITTKGPESLQETTVSATPRHVALAARLRVSGRQLWVVTPLQDVRCRQTPPVGSGQQTALPSCPTEQQAEEQLNQWLVSSAQRHGPVVMTRMSDQPDADGDKPQATERSSSKPEERLKCQKTKQPVIETRGHATETGIALGPLQRAADRPCAALAKLTFGAK